MQPRMTKGKIRTSKEELRLGVLRLWIVKS